MIFAIVEFIALLAVGGFLYYSLSGIALAYLESQVALYPAAFTVASITFTKAIINWLLLFMILGGVFGLIVWVQRTRPEGYY